MVEPIACKTSTQAPKTLANVALPFVAPSASLIGVVPVSKVPELALMLTKQNCFLRLPLETRVLLGKSGLEDTPLVSIAKPGNLIVIDREQLSLILKAGRADLLIYDLVRAAVTIDLQEGTGIYFYDADTHPDPLVAKRFAPIELAKDTTIPFSARVDAIAKVVVGSLATNAALEYAKTLEQPLPEISNFYDTSLRQEQLTRLHKLEILEQSNKCRLRGVRETASILLDNFESALINTEITTLPNEMSIGPDHWEYLSRVIHSDYRSSHATEILSREAQSLYSIQSKFFRYPSFTGHLEAEMLTHLRRSSREPFRLIIFGGGLAQEALSAAIVWHRCLERTNIKAESLPPIEITTFSLSNRIFDRLIEANLKKPFPVCFDSRMLNQLTSLEREDFFTAEANGTLRPKAKIIQGLSFVACDLSAPLNDQITTNRRAHCIALNNVLTYVQPESLDIARRNAAFLKSMLIPGGHLTIIGDMTLTLTNTRVFLKGWSEVFKKVLKPRQVTSAGEEDGYKHYLYKRVPTMWDLAESLLARFYDGL